jgi:hypothetical protein
MVLIFSQEVWLGNDELVNMYEKRLGDANYTLFKLARTNNRGDGELSLSLLISAWQYDDKISCGMYELGRW